EVLLEVVVAVDAQVGVVREVGAEVEKEGAKVRIDAVEVELVDWRRTLDNPRVLLARRIRSLLGAKDVGFFLGLAEKEDSLAAREAGPIVRGDIVLALAFLEVNDRDLVLLDEGLDLVQEFVGHDPHERRGCHRLTAMIAEKASGLFLRLQFRLIDVEVHAIDTFHFQGHVAPDDIGNATGYTHGWLRSTKVVTTTTASSGS